MPRLGDADRVCFANRSIPPVSATPTAFALRIGQFPPYAQSPSTTNRQNKRYAFHPVSALAKATPAPLFSSGRADNACTNLLGFLVRYVRTRGIDEVVGSDKTADFYIASVPHALATHGLRD